MKCDFFLAAVASLAAFVDAFPAFQAELDARATVPTIDHSYRPNIPGMQRSPCPGTNALANHGFIHRNGKGITRKAYTKGFLDAFGIKSVMTQKLMTGTFDTCRDVFNNGVTCNTIDLGMLRVPHRLEHDASITRDDATTVWNANGDNNSFNASVWQRSLDSLKPLGDITHLTFTTANTMRLRRVEQSRAENPNFVELVGPSLIEHAYYLTTMNDPALGNDIHVDPHARLDWVDHWFRHEELPTALGWVKPTAIITDPGKIGRSIALFPTIPAIGSSASSSSSATITQISSASSSTDAPSSTTSNAASPTDPATTTSSDVGVTTATTTDAGGDPTPPPQ